MAKPKILVTGIVSKDGLNELREKCDVTYSKDEFSREYVLEHLNEYDGLLLMGMKADKELIDAGKNLKVISVNGVGFDHVDIEYAKSKGIIVSNSPQSVRIPTAEMTFALILAAAKRLSFYDKVVREGNWIDVSHEKYQGLSLDNTTLGIFGMGRIGQTVAKIAQAFNMRVIYNDATRLSVDVEKELGFEFVDFEELLTTSDVLTIHVPLLNTTKGIFNDDAFRKMKKTSYIINAARGPIIKEADLVKALKNYEIAGAGLDVFEFEPTVSAELRSLDNVIMAPHAGTGTVAGRRVIAEEASNNLISYFFMNKPIHVVN
ncbi:NAD(P)-dependent oxidoreductase [Amphibacillus sp. Q70]|uniref:NAD(P)-dependent oxidoreductase n=1 Tax=Amphibacillus sp. Q70 TaxID=3453416 RepID=UPI003F84A751